MSGAIAWSRVVDALVRVEGVEPGECGLLSFGVDPARGGILVERGRICWAVAKGMEQRLRDLLVDAAAGRDVDFDAIYERCRDEGRLLGQTLVDEGWITADELELALRRHSAESLIELCRDDAVLPLWTSRGDQGYSPRFTFRPVELLLDVAALHVPDLQDAARLELSRVDHPDRRGAAFYADDHDLQIVVPIATAGALNVNELWSLGRWATSVRLATRELGTTPAFTLAATVAGDTLAVWWRGPLLFVIACQDRASAATLIALHLIGADA